MLPKRQKTLLLLMACVLGAMILGQFLSLAAVRDPKTVTAQLYQGDAPILVSGVVIRQEYTISAETTGNWIHQVQDGDKVAAGQTLFAWEESLPLANAAQTVRLLRRGIAAAAEPLVSRRENIREAIAALGSTEGAQRREASEILTGYLLGESEDLETQLENAEEALLSQGAEVSHEICAPEAGIFVSWADGLETILTPEQPWTEWALPVSPVDRLTMGRLVVGDTWYYRTTLSFVPEEEDVLDAMLLNGSFQTVEMTVEEIRRQEEGCQVLLSCREALAEVAKVRQLEIKLLPEEKTGVEIPAEAIYTVDGEMGVWCLVGEAAQFKPVTILERLGDQVVVELDQSTTQGLWPGDQVLLDEQ